MGGGAGGVGVMVKVGGGFWVRGGSMSLCGVLSVGMVVGEG